MAQAYPWLGLGLAQAKPSQAHRKTQAKPRQVKPSQAKNDSWLGIIISELPGHAEYKKVQWVNSEDRNALETVNHKAKDLVVISENR